jgi:outer membrane lipoprotein-sorting protein
MRSIKFAILYLFFVLAVFSVKAQEPKSIMNQMFSTVKTMKTLQFSFDSKERVSGKTVHEVSDFKINAQPYKAYVYQQSPTKGLEVLYISGNNGGKAKVNPNAFPWTTLNLDPLGSLMLDKHHHSVLEGGFGYTTSLIEFLVKKYDKDIDKFIVNNGIVKIQGLDCYYFTLNNPNYRLIRYTVGVNETPFSIAKKLNLNYFSIIENNSGLKATEVIKQGTVITIPNDYASKMELYIHKTKLYPLYLKIYDQKGLYEEYTFSNVIINPALTENTFSADNSAYHF